MPIILRHCAKFSTDKEACSLHKRAHALWCLLEAQTVKSVVSAEGSEAAAAAWQSRASSRIHNTSHLLE